MSAGIATARPMVAVSWTTRFFFSRFRKISNQTMYPSTIEAMTQVLPAIHSGQPSTVTRW